jgi:hypothetical protein
VRMLRPVATTFPAPSVTVTPALPKRRVVAVHNQRLTGLQIARRQPAARHDQPADSCPPVASAASISPIRVSFWVGTSICSAKEP